MHLPTLRKKNMLNQRYDISSNNFEKNNSEK